MFVKFDLLILIKTQIQPIIVKMSDNFMTYSSVPLKGLKRTSVFARLGAESKADTTTSNNKVRPVYACVYLFIS